MGSESWFNNPDAQASAHFGVGKDGEVRQWVDTKDKAWAQKAGNSTWLSVETEGKHTEPLTAAQITALAKLLKWVCDTYKVPVQLAKNSSDRGLAYHSIDPTWGHPDCPGTLRKGQMPDIVSKAAPKPTPPPAPKLARDLYYRRKDPFTGGQVPLLQKRLNASGAKLSTDGVFGPATLGAVKKFQTAHKLNVDGVVGAKTWAALWK